MRCCPIGVDPFCSSCPSAWRGPRLGLCAWHCPCPGLVEDRSDRLLTGGVVSGDVEQVAGGTGLQAAKLMDQGLAGRPGEECADDVCVDDIREGVASLGEPMDVIP